MYTLWKRNQWNLFLCDERANAHCLLSTAHCLLVLPTAYCGLPTVDCPLLTVHLQQDNVKRRMPVSHKYPPGDWTHVPHDRKQSVHPLDQWDFVWMQWDCRLSTGLPPAADYVSREAGRKTCSTLETGTEELCEIMQDYNIVGTTTLWQFGTKPASDEATMIYHVGVTNVARQS